MKRSKSYRWKNLMGSGVFVCPGYEGHPCNKKVKRTSPKQKWCLECAEPAKRIRRTINKRNRRKNEPGFREKELAIIKAWYKKNRKRILEQRRKYRRTYFKRLKDEVYEAYGGYKCQCPGCRVTEPLFLTLDHVKNNAKKILKLHGNERGMKQLLWIKKNGFPKGMFLVMCWNCNCGRARNGGVCPHLRRKQNGKR